MNDIIDRQAATELIKNYCENGCQLAEDNWCPSCQREQFVKLLKCLPSTQPEIIRCRDCIHAHDHDCPVNWGRTDDDYCSWAEKEENCG